MQSLTRLGRGSVIAFGSGRNIRGEVKMNNQFVETIRRLTEPINGQYPRPWMTTMTNPWEAEVFIVGMNQKKGYAAGNVSHNRHLDALFNRNGESCRGLYDELSHGKPSSTRKNTDGLVRRLHNQGISNILETNVICYSTPMSGDFRKPEHTGGTERGEDIFRYLVSAIAPAVIIVHGVGAAKRISPILHLKQLKLPRSPGEICDVQVDKHLVIPILSLAPPAFSRWQSWSNRYLDEVSHRVRRQLT